MLSLRALQFDMCSCTVIGRRFYSHFVFTMSTNILIRQADDETVSGELFYHRTNNPNYTLRNDISCTSSNSITYLSEKNLLICYIIHERPIKFLQMYD